MQKNGYAGGNMTHILQRRFKMLIPDVMHQFIQYTHVSTGCASAPNQGLNTYSYITHILQLKFVIYRFKNTPVHIMKCTQELVSNIRDYELHYDKHSVTQVCQFTGSCNTCADCLHLYTKLGMKYSIITHILLHRLVIDWQVCGSYVPN